MWDREAAGLAKDHTVVRYDLRAHGKSDLPIVPTSNGADLLSVLDELDLRDVTLIGLSAGATAALDAVIENPARVRRLILASPSVGGYVAKQRLTFFGDVMTALNAKDYKKANEALLATPVFAVPANMQALVRSMVTENERLWTVTPDMMRRPGRVALEHLTTIKLPVLVLLGGKDVPATAEHADVLAKGVPGAQLVVIPDGGHLLNLTSPAAFDSAVREFLAR
jgi:pimeloyl-ACP methyl ester carboxylesterase